MLWPDGTVEVTVGGALNPGGGASHKGTYQVVNTAEGSLALKVKGLGTSPATVKYSFGTTGNLVLTGKYGATYHRR